MSSSPLSSSTSSSLLFMSLSKSSSHLHYQHVLRIQYYIRIIKSNNTNIQLPYQVSSSWKECSTFSEAIAMVHFSFYRSTRDLLQLGAWPELINAG
jgi:hypothetical protein